MIQTVSIHQEKIHQISIAIFFFFFFLYYPSAALVGNPRSNIIPSTTPRTNIQLFYYLLDFNNFSFHDCTLMQNYLNIIYLMHNKWLQ